jgi:lipopolysaccharide export system protein LptC
MPNTHNRHKRTAHRWPLIGLMTGGVFLALGSFWLVQVMQNPETLGANAKSSEPDYIVENFSFVRMTPDGKPGYVLSGESLSHRPDVDVSDIDKPVMHNMTPGRPPMTVTAKTAKVLHVQNQIDLAGNVDVQRPASGTTKALRIRSEALTALPDEEIVKTVLPVEIQLGRASLKGVGMQANNATQTLHVDSHTQIVYPPRQSR